MTVAHPSVSVIVEWDNPHLYADDARQHRSLARLQAELSALQRTFEAIVVCDARDAHDVAMLTSRYLGAFRPTVIEVQAEGYYAMKNAGCAAARGEIVVLWDSDIEPEPGALQTMLAAFDDDAARQVVAGAAFIDSSTLLGRLWSVLSVFPPRPREEILQRVPAFFANFVAFRRDVLARYQFDEDSCMRMQCVALSARLQADGIAIWHAAGARVRHPAPDGARGLLQRALWHAHDMLEIHAHGHRRVRAALRAMASIAAANGRRARKLATQRRALGIAVHEVPLIAAMIVAFGVAELLLLPFMAVHPELPKWAA